MYLLTALASIKEHDDTPEIGGVPRWVVLVGIVQRALPALLNTTLCYAIRLAERRFAVLHFR